MKSPESAIPAKSAPAPNNLFAAMNTRARGPCRVWITAFIMPCGMAAIERVYCGAELTALADLSLPMRGNSKKCGPLLPPMTG